MSFLQKIQNLPESKRKIILWLIVIVISLILLIFWVKNVQKTLSSFPKEEIKGKFKEMLKFEMPKLEMPEISEEELKKLEEELKKLEEGLKKEKNLQ